MQLATLYYPTTAIHVAQAEASREGGVMKVFIELRDLNYPGSTYTLSYGPRAISSKASIIRPSKSSASRWRLCG